MACNNAESQSTQDIQENQNDTTGLVQPVIPSYTEMKQQVNKRFQWMLSEGIVTRNAYNLFTKTMLNDIAFCEKATDKDNTVVKNKLLKSLSILSRNELETEDREAVAEWYYMLSFKTKVDIKKDLNKWLYPFLEN